MKWLVGWMILVAFLGEYLMVIGQDSPNLLKDNAVDRMIRDVAELSSPEYPGRQAGTSGGHDSATFVATRFEGLGLLPLFMTPGLGSIPSYYQKGGLSIPTLYP